MPLQIRRGTNAERLAMTQPLAQGELLYVTNDQRLYIGDGNLLGGIAVTGYTDNDAKDSAAAIFTDGAHSGINFAYNTATNIITATVNLSNYTGTINASSFKGTLVADDSTLLIDAIDGKINLDGTVKGNIIPDANEAYDVGSASNRFRDLYLSGSSIELGAATITAVGSVVNLPAGSTVAGVLIGSATGDGVIEGSNYKINIVGDDSTVIVNSSTKTVTASFVGNVTGNINGVVTGTAGSSLVGNVTGDVNGVVTGTAGSSLVGNVTGNLLGNVTGDTVGYHTGDVKGSVYGDDSTLIVDAVSNIISIEEIYSSTSSLNVGSVTNPTALTISSDDEFALVIKGITDGSTAPNIDLQISKGTLASPTSLVAGDEIGGINIKSYDGSIYKSTTAILSVLSAAADMTDANPESELFIAVSAGGSNFSIFNLKGDGTFVAPGAVQLAVYADDAARSAAIPVPAKGMMVFMTSGTAPAVANKTVVYDGTSWVALH
jgi:hypothetical protein